MVENKGSGFMYTSVSDRESPSTINGDDAVLVEATAAPNAQDTVLYSPEVSNNTPLTLDGVETRNSTTSDQDDSNSEDDITDSRMVGAGVAGGVVGLLFGGPILATIAGFGAAWATSKDSPAGDVARAMGDVALTARDKARELNEKHQFTENTKQAASRAVEQVQEYERQHSVVAKTKEFFVFSWTKIADFNREHHVMERAVQKMGQAVSYLVTTLVGTNSDDDDENESRNTTQSRGRRDYTVVPSDAEPSVPSDKTTCDAQPF